MLELDLQYPSVCAWANSAVLIFHLTSGWNGGTVAPASYPSIHDARTKGLLWVWSQLGFLSPCSEKCLRSLDTSVPEKDWKSQSEGGREGGDEERWNLNQTPCRQLAGNHGFCRMQLVKWRRVSRRDDCKRKTTLQRLWADVCHRVLVCIHGLRGDGREGQGGKMGREQSFTVVDDARSYKWQCRLPRGDLVKELVRLSESWAHAAFWKKSDGLLIALL